MIISSRCLCDMMDESVSTLVSTDCTNDYAKQLAKLNERKAKVVEEEVR